MGGTEQAAGDGPAPTQATDPGPKRPGPQNRPQAHTPWARPEPPPAAHTHPVSPSGTERAPALSSAAAAHGNRTDVSPDPEEPPGHRGNRTIATDCPQAAARTRGLLHGLADCFQGPGPLLPCLCSVVLPQGAFRKDLPQPSAQNQARGLSHLHPHPRARHGGEAEHRGHWWGTESRMSGKDRARGRGQQSEGEARSSPTAPGSHSLPPGPCLAPRSLFQPPLSLGVCPRLSGAAAPGPGQGAVGL